MKSGGKGCVIAVLVLLIGITIIPERGAHENSVKNGYVDDTTPPRTFIELSGEHWPQSEEYYTPVEICIYAIEDYGMGEIHYLLNYKETVVPGYIAKFTVDLGGYNNLEYWGVDASGNEEVPHHTLKFIIEYPSGPFIHITFPLPGLYLFGNRFMDLNKILIIGSFAIEADAYDDFYGIKNVEFYLDDTLVGKTSTPPYGVYCSLEHFGAAEIKAIATNNQNDYWEDTLDIEYYKFFGRGSL